MQIQIQFIAAQVEDKGKWKQAEISYKDLAKGQVTSKKLMSFSNPVVYKTLVDAKNGEVYTIDMEKNDKGYWDWIKVASSTSVDTSNAVSPTKANASPKSTYETPEERAKRQVLIVRQSSVASAIDLLKNEKKPPTVNDVLTTANIIYNWVFENEEIIPLADLPALDDDSDIPL